MRAGLVVGLVLLSGEAEAGLTLCNDGVERASVAIAYAADGTWTSEGWWGIEPGACAVVQAGDLRQQHFYFTLSGTDFAGEGFAFCTKPDAFTLTGADGDCAGLAAESRAFSHIDTGPEATEFTFRLAAGGAGKQADAAAFDEIPLQAEDVASLLDSAAMPSFERGVIGEPFLVDAILQGCGPTEGMEACTFYAEGARWIVSASGQSNPAAMQAMAALPVGTALRISGDMLSFGDITAEAAIASLERIEDAYAAERAAMQGEWVSADDPQSRVQIAGSEWTDIYGDELLAVAILTLSDRCGDAQGGVLLSQQRMGYDPADMQCYEVLSVDGDRMELSYLPRGNTLVYERP
jgi:uncharacterized membrane protein